MRRRGTSISPRERQSHEMHVSVLRVSSTIPTPIKGRGTRSPCAKLVWAHLPPLCGGRLSSIFFACMTHLGLLFSSNALSKLLYPAASARARPSASIAGLMSDTTTRPCAPASLLFHRPCAAATRSADRSARRTRNATSPVPPATSKCTWPGTGLRRSTRSSFHRRCMPPDMRSFMRSYLGATAEKTSATRPRFSSTATERKPGHTAESRAGSSDTAARSGASASGWRRRKATHRNAWTRTPRAGALQRCWRPLWTKQCLPPAALQTLLTPSEPRRCVHEPARAAGAHVRAPSREKPSLANMALTTFLRIAHLRIEGDRALLRMMRRTQHDAVRVAP